MKRTLRILAAGLAASLALVSCDKESLTKTDNGATKDGVRTITVSFADVTRSELNGLQPSFKVGDKIMVSNGSKSEECTVSIDKGVASITINDVDLQTAELTAVYPAAAWSDSEPYFTVSADKQDGSFAMANICKATIPAGSKDAVFENQTAILKFSVPAKADGKGVDYSPKTIKVTSRGSENIADGSKEITITGKDGGAISKSDNNCYYMAVLPGETISKLTVCSGEGMRCPTASGTLAANTIYDVALPVLNGHEYVELTIPVMTRDSGNRKYIPTGSKKTLRWATTNVGASSPTDYGDYFAWGETTGHAAATNGENAFVSGFTENSKGFSWTNCPLSNHDDYYYFSKYVPEASKTDYGIDGHFDDKDTLDLEDDAANVNWGGSWRMPTKEEFAGLAALDPEFKGWDDDNKGYILTDENGNSIFLPAAGFGEGTDLSIAGDFGSYRSSSLDTDEPYYAFTLFFEDGSIFADSLDCYRDLGFSVRPLSE